MAIIKYHPQKEAAFNGKCNNQPQKINLNKNILRLINIIP
jgi:hypothetical protein